MTLHSGFLTSAGVEVTWKCCLPAKKTVLRSINVTQHPSFSLPEPPKVYFNSPLLLPSRNLRRYISTHLIFLLTGTFEGIFQHTSIQLQTHVLEHSASFSKTTMQDISALLQAVRRKGDAFNPDDTQSQRELYLAAKGLADALQSPIERVAQLSFHEVRDEPRLSPLPPSKCVGIH